MNHIKKWIENIPLNQWIGLFFALIASTLAWTKLIFIISPLKGNKPKVGRYQIYALLIGWVITVFGWSKLVSVVGNDSMNNGKCNCNCNCK